MSREVKFRVCGPIEKEGYYVRKITPISTGSFGKVLCKGIPDEETAKVICDALRADFFQKKEAEGVPLGPNDELFNADPTCDHRIVAAGGGGVRCIKCPGWFCY